MSLKKSYKTFFGMTLIEVMIAIIIFGTGVIVVMGMLMSNVRWLYAIKEKDTAVSIAKEGLDIVYHIRDSNLERGGFWNCALIDTDEDDKCGDYFFESGTGKSFLIGMDRTGTYTVTSDPFSLTDSTIYFHSGELYSGFTGFWFDHDNTGNPTIYSRTITFSPLSGYEAYTGFVLEVTSTVDYTKGSGESRQAILQSIVGYIR